MCYMNSQLSHFYHSSATDTPLAEQANVRVLVTLAVGLLEDTCPGLQGRVTQGAGQQRDEVGGGGRRAAARGRQAGEGALRGLDGCSASAVRCSIHKHI